MIQGLDHVNVRTINLEATVQFYQELLELQTGPRPPLASAGVWLYAGEKPLIHVSVVSELPTGESALNHFALLITDYDAMRRRLLDHHLSFQEVETPAWGMRQIFVQDPNGVRIELQARE